MSTESILIVEKDATDRDVIAAVVSKLGFPFQTALNTREAIQLMDGEVFPIIISDIRCETEDGHGVMDRIRMIEQDPPFVVMTGYGIDYSFDRVFGADAREFIKKPFTSDQVENRLKRIFHERRLIKENETLQKQQTELNEQLKALLSVSADLTSELGFDRLFPLIIGKISEAMCAERTSLYVIDWEQGELWTRCVRGNCTPEIKAGRRNQRAGGANRGDDLRRGCVGPALFQSGI